MNPDQPLNYGMFMMPIHNPAKPKAQCYDEDLELISRCEEWGYKEFWVGEHHTSSYENIVMPEIFLGKAFGLTQKIRMGPAPVCLQYHNPAQVAGRLAFLDHLSKGRLNICFGPGAVPSDLEVHNVEPKNSGAMVAESIDMILKLWGETPPQEMTGKFWNYSLKENVSPQLGTGVVHRPFQLPHPPIALPCMSRGSGTVKLAGARGFRPISHHMLHREVFKDHWATYSEAAQRAGREPRPQDWAVSLNIFVADSTAEARRAARENTVCRTINYILEFTRRFAGELKLFRRDPDMNDADCNLDYFMDEVVVAGDPAEVTSQILQLRAEVGPFGTLVLVAHDWDDKERHIHSLELFAQEVMPALHRELSPSTVSS
jgi:alkanesulfonate monooxygenase SsuD/methylene tetrahydromethanopterin reductase-like flavin-dependent oxidoreductase (luciferase family)